MINYNIRLKEVIKTFTKRLFYNLFDEQFEETVFLKKTFLEITSKLDIKEGERIWNEFQDQFLTIREKLNLDAVSFLKNDPASTCIEEVYLAYPGFYAISIYRLSHQLKLLL